MLYYNNLNIIIIVSDIFDQLIDFFDSKPYSKILLECLLVYLALMILSV